MLRLPPQCPDQALQGPNHGHHQLVYRRSIRFGGQANLLESIQNIFTIYDPEVIAVNTTCLSEVIGDDIGQIINKAQAEGKIPAGRGHPRQYAEL
jgi:hypothetical protein